MAASVFDVLHPSPESPGMLPDMRNRLGTLPAANAGDGERIQPCRLRVAPPGRRLLVEPGVVRFPRGLRENRFRPAADPFCRSEATRNKTPAR